MPTITQSQARRIVQRWEWLLDRANHPQPTRLHDAVDVGHWNRRAWMRYDAQLERKYGMSGAGFLTCALGMTNVIHGRNGIVTHCQKEG